MKMKILLTAIAAAALSACSTAKGPIRLTVGAPVHDKKISGLVLFPVRLSNDSKQPIWYSANIVPWMPYYRAFTRPSKFGRWKELPYGMCSVGAKDFEIKAGAFAMVETVAPLDEAGYQYRVQLSVTKERGNRAKSLKITSEPVVIR